MQKKYNRDKTTAPKNTFLLDALVLFNDRMAQTNYLFNYLYITTF